MKLDFYKDINYSHNQHDMQKYLSIINEFFQPEFIFSWELSNMKYPFDLQISTNNGLKNIEIKNVNYGTYSLALEQYTDTDQKIQGWTHNLINNEIDYVLFNWRNSEYYALIDAPILCNWWHDIYNNYELILNKISKRGNNEWQSSYSYVPIIQLPRECRIKINTKYLKENI